MSHDAESTASAVSRSTEVIEVETRTRLPRGFAALDASARSAISRKGGQAAHRAGTAHKFTSDEARAAGKKGSQVTHSRRRAGAASA
jgi:general stress protein YciG